MSWATLIGAASYVGTTISAAQISEEAGLVVFLALFGLVEFARWRYAPRLAQLRILGDGESVRFPLTEAEENAKAEQAEIAALAAELEEARSEDRGELDSRTDWVCPTCHETNPRNFETCWKCERARL